MTLQEFYELLERHDWYYDMSDEHSVWVKGGQEASRIAAIAKESEKHGALYKAYYEHMFSGKTWGTKKAPKPERPVS